MSQSKIENAIADTMEQIEAVDDDLIIEVVSVAQALDQLRKALDKVDKCLDKREFNKASSLGYSDVSSEFIFLQRTLGSLQSAQAEKESLVSEIVMKANATSYEEVEPFVNEKMVSSKELTEQDKIENKAAIAAMRNGE